MVTEPQRCNQRSYSGKAQRHLCGTYIHTTESLRKVKGKLYGKNHITQRGRTAMLSRLHWGGTGVGGRERCLYTSFHRSAPGKSVFVHASTPDWWYAWGNAQESKKVSLLQRGTLILTGTRTELRRKVLRLQNIAWNQDHGVLGWVGFF